MKRRTLPILITASALTLAACNNDSGDSKDGKQADKGEVLIESKAGKTTTGDILDEMGSDAMAQQAFQITISDILEDKYKDKVDKKKLEEEADKEIEKYGGKESFEQLMQQQNPGMTVDSFKSQKVQQAYQEKLFDEEFEISDKQLKEDTQKGSHILIKVKSDDQQEEDKKALSDKEAKKKAEDLLKQVKEDPKKFGELAKKHTMDAGTKEKDGSLGYVTKGQTVEEFEKVLFNTEEGKIHDELVKTDFGYHIIKHDKEDDFDKQKDQLKNQLRQSLLQEEPNKVKDIYKKLLDEYKVDYKNEDIKKFVEEKILADQEQQPAAPSAEESK
ncbi:foldase protein PrsA [Abyssicoccus albus]|uniref:peptidylprolyl isomerase n=1 Tax=Abyssicoccus albus TaxID=1817405 RepID=UPI00097E17F7|nr:foldase protein PrsA [Abyssicoccus albus]AQL55855.1 peptidylprolyl isomerase [Abyssicoccus albus]